MDRKFIGSHMANINFIPTHKISKTNSGDSKHSIIAENSTGRVERFLCPVCCNEVGANDTECSECYAQLNFNLIRKGSCYES